jgi:hypothetical protein
MPPLGGLAPSCPSYPDRDYLRMMRETTNPRFVSRGHLPLSGPMERYICPCWLSPAYGNLDNTQILTRHRGAKSQTV